MPLTYVQRILTGVNMAWKKKKKKGCLISSHASGTVGCSEMLSAIGSVPLVRHDLN